MRWQGEVAGGCEPQVWSGAGASSVEIKGSFDGWETSRRLEKQPDASWAIAAYLAPGMYQVPTAAAALRPSVCTRMAVACRSPCSTIDGQQAKNLRL